MDSSIFFGVSTVAYIIAMMAYISFISFKKPGIGLAATIITITGFLCQTTAIILRWIEFYEMNQRLGLEGIMRAAPLTNLYESMIFFVWCIILAYLVIEFKYKSRSFGAFVTPVAGIVLAFIEMSGMSKGLQPLVPALQSNWLLVHVFMSFVAYAGFAVAFSTALMYLIINTERHEKRTKFWIVFLIFVMLFGITTNNPQVVIMWILSFALVVALDIKLNIDITNRIYSKGTGGPAAMLKIKTVLTTIALSLVSVAAIFIFIQLVKLQLITAEEGAKMKQLGTSGGVAEFKGSVMGTVGLLFFVGIVFIKYLILEKGYYLFWTLTTGIFVIVISAMGLDFLKYKVVGDTLLQGESMLLKTTFLSNNQAIAIFSYVIAVVSIYLIWRYGHALRRVILAFNISSELLDEITYKGITIAFPIYTVGGLIFGAIWADQAWGVYWSWDPKETWSLITWFFYAFFLHSRLLRGWKGLKVSVVAVVSFFIVIFTYLGVNLLLSGLHAYAS
jgi:cytochrome c-type biogenesis protein CcsB